MPLELDYEVAGLGDDAVDYLAAWDLQRRVHEAVVAGTRTGTVLLLEHPPVFTAGKRTDPHERPADPGGADVIDVDRGGKITFHGPGQLVGYPIVSAARPRQGRRLRPSRRGGADRGLRGLRRDHRPRAGAQRRLDAADDRGPERKVGAIGIRVSRGVTMHGFALNCDVDLGWYDRFVPCGIADAGVTSLSTRSWAATSPLQTCCRACAGTCRRTSPGSPTTPTPDYDARPEPGRGPRIELVRP